jgi:hypothetical protein
MPLNAFNHKGPKVHKGILQERSASAEQELNLHASQYISLGGSAQWRHGLLRLRGVGSERI